MKKILITYMNNGDFKNTIERKVMLKKLTEDLQATGKELNMEAHFVFGTISTFTDGSQILSMPIDQIGKTEESKDFTQAYVSSNLKETALGSKGIYSTLKNFMTTEKITYFSVDNNQVTLS